MPESLLCIAVVGHTNVGKTSLLRTLTRRVDFGQTSRQPGTTRHAEAVDLRLDGPAQVRFIDTPGLEDSVALLEFLERQPGDTRPARVRAFLQGPEARAAFEQEAKVLRALVERADAAMLVIDVREPVLPKYRAEVEILSWCACPLMPVFNFVRDPRGRADAWHQVLRESGLHVRVAFDAVAPFHGAERDLYRDLATLLPARRQQLQAIADALVLQQRDRLQAAGRVVASSLVDVAAMRRSLPAADFADDLRRQTFVRAFQDDVRRHAHRAVDDLLALFGFRAGDAQLATLPESSGRWADDLFNPELLKEAGTRLGWGAMLGAGAGAVADIALAGLSLGAATAIGATVGGAASGGWRPMWRKLENRWSGTRELTAEDPVLALLASHLCALARALAERGHAAQQQLQVTGADGSKPDAGLKAVIRALGSARGHPRWERGAVRFFQDADRAALCDDVARMLAPLLGQEAHRALDAPAAQRSEMAGPDSAPDG